MKIECTKEITSFLDRCRYHIYNDEKNDFLGMHVTKSNEKKVQRMMHDAGFAEFSGKESSWPSLFLSVKDWEQSPYHANVSLDMVKDGHFSFETERIAGHELFNADCIQKDPKRELNDSMKLRAMDANFDAIYLLQDDEDWMLDAPSEAATNNVPAKKAHGDILTFGLGIGYFLYIAMENDKVTSITVVEKSEAVIAMFNRFLWPQFPHNKPVKIIQGDAFEMFNEKTFNSYDYIYTDIWKSSNDGLITIEKLLQLYLPPYEKASFWIEDSCFEIMWTLIFLYFDALAHHHKPSVNPAYASEMKKIRLYFEGIHETLSQPEQLQFYMYDTETIRKILSLK